MAEKSTSSRQIGKDNQPLNAGSQMTKGNIRQRSGKQTPIRTRKSTPGNATTRKNGQSAAGNPTARKNRQSAAGNPTARKNGQITAGKQANREKKRSTKPLKNKRPKASMLEILLTGTIIVMIMAIMSSLFFYLHPFTWEEVKDYASAYIEEFIKKRNGGSDKVTAEQNFSSEEESPSYINYTTDMGNISDFTSEPVFPEQDDSIYSFIMDTSLGPMLYYNQGDLRWKSYLYGGSDPLSKYGCGPVCVAMIINSFGSSSVSPVETADWAAQNGCYARHGGSYHRLIPDSLSAFGLQVESVSDHTAEQAAELLRSGYLLVALMGKGSLTNNGHFIIITQLAPSGNVYIADPASYENSTKEWDLQLLMDELKQSYDSGGPLWAVTLSSGGA